MVTGYPQVLVGPQSAANVAEARKAASSVVMRMFRRLGQMLCGLSGHDLVRHYEQNRVALVCASCGHVSPGWELTAPLPHQRYAGDPGRHHLHVEPRPVQTRTAAAASQPRLVTNRRVA